MCCPTAPSGGDQQMLTLLRCDVICPDQQMLTPGRLPLLLTKILLARPALGKPSCALRTQWGSPHGTTPVFALCVLSARRPPGERADGYDSGWPPASAPPAGMRTPRPSPRPGAPAEKPPVSAPRASPLRTLCYSLCTLPIRSSPPAASQCRKEPSATAPWTMPPAGSNCK